MAPKRPITNRLFNNTQHLPGGKQLPYYRRPVPRIQARSIEGISERSAKHLATKQGEPLEPLVRGSARLSSGISRLPTEANGPDNIFGIKLGHLLGPVSPKLVPVKAYLPVICLALILFISVAGFSSLRSGNHAEANRSYSRASIEPMIDNGNEITERRPTNIQSYQVAGNLPRIFHIDDMGLSARVRRVGVGTETEIRLPSNIYDAGWYEGSVKPGEVGAVVLTGHASGPSKPGIFHDLAELKPGDEIRLETGDGKTYIYYVAKLQAFRDVDPLEPMLATAVPGVPGLNLVTETGAYDTKSNSYNKRLVVYAIQKNSSTPANN